MPREINKFTETVIVALLLCVVCAHRNSFAQAPIRHPLASPRLRALRRELKSGHRNALELFWREVARKGAPLVEPLKDDDQNMLVTFLWRARGKTGNVAVFPLARADILSNLMARLPGTDVWYISYRMRRDARFTYRISPNDSLIPMAAVN